MQASQDNQCGGAPGDVDAGGQNREQVPVGRVVAHKVVGEVRRGDEEPDTGAGAGAGQSETSSARRSRLSSASRKTAGVSVTAMAID